MVGPAANCLAQDSDAAVIGFALCASQVELSGREPALDTIRRNLWPAKSRTSGCITGMEVLNGLAERVGKELSGYKRQQVLNSETSCI